jgi:1-acyl-sn-glycerol-3-phosphate acyltransferase
MSGPLTRILYPLYAAVVAGVLMFGLFCPLIILMPTLPLRRAVGRFAVRSCLLLIGVRLRVLGTAQLPAGACIAVANHASYIDGLVLTAALPGRFTFVVQDGARDWPYIGLVIRRMGVSFVNRVSAREGAMQTRALVRRLGEGESLAIFAEGTFESAPGLLAFKNGAFLMAARAGVPVVPVALRGTRRLFGGEPPRLRWSRVEVEILPPVSPAGTEKEAAARLRAEVRAAILARCGEPDAAPVC